MQQAQIITSDDLLNDTEHHFRVFAGPGAGKSYWLVRHIRNVIARSARLSPPARIACISYTNVAAEEIRERLGDYSGRVEVSTIHSFLYRNVVKPYLHLFKDQNGKPLVAYELVNGHDEHRPSFQKVKNWVTSVQHTWVLQIKDQLEILFEKLRELVWDRNASSEWIIRPRKTDRMGPKLLDLCRNQNLRSYKSLYWHDGIIDHEDVLYFAHRVLDEYDIVVEFLSARFRYLFIDEFQDTRPVQSQMVKQLAGKGTIVGVIGDEQQSIYGFLGAKPDDFRNFSLVGHRDYRIENNRRSTERIVHLLNHVRMDGLHQASHRGEEGEPVRLYSGTVRTAVSSVEQRLPKGSTLAILTRKNNEAGRVRNSTDEDKSSLWEYCKNIDWERAVFLEGVLAATELGRDRRFAMALDGLLRVVTKRGQLREPLRSTRNLSLLGCRGVAVALLEFMLTNYSTLSRGSVLLAYQSMDEYLKKEFDVSLKGVQRGRGFHSFAESTNYATLASSVHPTEETRSVRTIHQAKGAEWKNVVVWFSEADRIRHILQSSDDVDDEEREERRITYVAMSRARDRLFIVVPELSIPNHKAIEKLGIEVVRLEPSTVIPQLY